MNIKNPLKKGKIFGILFTVFFLFGISMFSVNYSTISMDSKLITNSMLLGEKGTSHTFETNFDWTTFWVQSEIGSTDISIISSYGGETDVVYASDNDGIQYFQFMQNIGANVIVGTVTFKIRVPQTDKEIRIGLAGDEIVNTKCNMEFGADGHFKVGTTTNHVNLDTDTIYNANVWYIITMEFNCTSEIMKIYIDGVLKSQDAFSNSGNDIRQFYISSYPGSQTSADMYMAWFDYSWEPPTESPTDYDFDISDEWIASWIESEPGSTNISILPTYGGSSDVIHGNDSDISQYFHFLQNFATNQVIGTVIFKIRVPQTDKEVRIGLAGDVGVSTKATIEFGSDGHFKVGNSTTFKNLDNDTTYNADTWYTIKLIFDCVSDVMTVFIDGVRKSVDNFAHTSDDMRQFYFSSFPDIQNSVDVYIDWVDYSWLSEENTTNQPPIPGFEFVFIFIALIGIVLITLGIKKKNQFI
ncbi:MAG: hypothetical protein ACTSVY_11755 [Candidatus Helarchaeota archaeon]